ncbi:MAG TPA: carboxylesterase family protein [Spirochaetia bacterium]|nr:carboxylesterase family protein [Spirochaetia bacterium]
MESADRARRWRPRWVIALALIACGSAGAAALPRPGTPWTGSPVVATRSGVVQAEEDADQTWVWKAIPFARPPVGDLRWRAPQDPVPWDGVRRGTRFAERCTQFSAVFPGMIDGTEDCLYLNVWRPRDAEAGLPVYVWIHGGGNSTGSATMVPEFHGNRISSRSHVVFVSLAYRLGPFGWFTLPALREGASPEDASGNFGTLDLVQGLKWIQENIEGFGGDPHRVILTGESAGGMNVLSLLISPPARGLFQAAVSESGAALTRSMEDADAMGQTVLGHLLVKAGRARSLEEAARVAQAMSPAAIRDFLRARSDREVLSQYHVLGLGNLDFPSILRDGAVIPSNGYDSLTTGEYPNKVPLILGSNADELKLFLRFTTRISWQTEVYQALSRYGSERWTVSAVDEPARRMVAHADQPPIYAYSFRWGTVQPDGSSVLPNLWGRELGAFHSLDIPFFLGHDTLAGFFQVFLFSWQNEPGRKALSADIMRYTAAFARTGDPNPADAHLPRWEPWSTVPGGPRRIIFDATLSEPRISMSDWELTDEQVMRAADTELSDPLRSQVLAWLKASPLPAGVH